MMAMGVLVLVMMVLLLVGVVGVMVDPGVRGGMGHTIASNSKPKESVTPVAIW